MRKALASLSVVMLLGAGASAQSKPAGQGAPAFSAERLSRIDRALQQYVDESRIAGVVALVLRDGQPVYERAIGWSDKEAGRRMTMRPSTSNGAMASAGHPRFFLCHRCFRLSQPTVAEPWPDGYGR